MADYFMFSDEGNELVTKSVESLLPLVSAGELTVVEAVDRVVAEVEANHNEVHDTMVRDWLAWSFENMRLPGADDIGVLNLPKEH